jgi:hypothetical protein
MNYYDGGIWVVINPDKKIDDSTNPAKCYEIRLENVTGISGDDIYTATIKVDSSNKDHLWVSAHRGKYIKIDISNITGSTTIQTPTLLYKNDYWFNIDKAYHPFYMSTGCVGLKCPENDIIIIRPRSYYNYYYGWLDTENMLPVTSSYYVDYDKKGNNSYRYNSSQQLKFGYGTFPIPIYSDNTTKYWLIGGAGSDGNKIWVFDSGLTLHTSGYITFGKFEIGGNIRNLKIFNLKDNVFELTGTSFDVYVSNNNGSAWEVYDWDNEEMHHFNSLGNEALVKFKFTGYQGIKSPYINSLDNTQIGIWISDDMGIDSSGNTMMSISGG